MTFPNPAIGDLVATTIENYSREAADAVTRNNGLLNRLKKRGNNKAYVPIDGGTAILQEIQYAQNSTSMWYSGYEQINIQPSQIFTAAQYPIRQAAVAVTFSGLEELMNAGEERMIELVAGRVENAANTLQSLIAVGIYSDGTTPKSITGLQALVSTSPSSGTIGGIPASTWAFWRNIAFSAITNGGAAATASNINRYMDAVYAQLVRGSDKPDLWVADNNYWMLYKQSMQPMQITESSEMAQAGFQNIMYMGSPVIMDGGFQGYGTYGLANASDYMPDGGVPANTMYALNTRYMHYRPHRDRNFVPIRGDRWSVNQDATVRLTGWAGALTTSNRRFQGVLSA